MTREEAIKIIDCYDIGFYDLSGEKIPADKLADAFDMAIEALSADATKKKAELKENGDWDCPDVYCDECDHHRSVEWCSLAIPSHEEKIDDTYKMVTEAFFEGFDAAEEQYRLLIETIEELEKKSADAVQGEWIEVEDYNGDVHYKCDQCGEEWTFPFGTPKENNANFCPCCGARMKGGDSE